MLVNTSRGGSDSSAAMVGAGVGGAVTPRIGKRTRLVNASCERIVGGAFSECVLVQVTVGVVRRGASTHAVVWWRRPRVVLHQGCCIQAAAATTPTAVVTAETRANRT